MQYKNYELPEDDIDARIAMCYIDILQRYPDPAGLGHYRTLIKEKNITYDKLRSLLSSSTEFLQLQVILDSEKRKMEQKEKELEKYQGCILFLAYSPCPRAIKEFLLLKSLGYPVYMAYYVKSPYLEYVEDPIQFSYTEEGVKELLNKIKPSIVHNHNMPDEACVWARKFFKGTLIQDVHDYWNFKTQESMFKAAINVADYVVTVNEDFADFLEKKYNKKVFVSHSSMPHRSRERKTKLSSLDNKIHICFIGSLYNPEVAEGTCQRLLDVANKLDIHIHLHSSGYRDIASKYTNKLFHLEEQIPLLKIPPTLSQYDAGIIITHGDSKCSHYDDQELVYSKSLPNKFYDYLDAGIPIIIERNRTFCANMVEKNNLGLVLDKFEDLSISALRNILNIPIGIYSRHLITELPPYFRGGYSPSSEETDILIICDKNTAGIPKFLSESINRYTNYKCRWVQNSNTMSMHKEDLTFNSENFIKLLKSAKAIHWDIHGYSYYKKRNIFDFSNYLSGKIQTKHYHGSELRNHGTLKQYSPMGPIEDKFIRGVFVATPDLLWYRPDAFLLPNPMDAPDIETSFPEIKSVVHTPTAFVSIRDYTAVMNNVGLYPFFPGDCDVKGTKLIRSSLDKIIADGYKVNYSIQSNLTWEQCLLLKSKCSYYIDQLWVGTYGLNAIEAMYLKKPVMCRIDKRFIPYFNQWLEEELPFLNIDLGTLENDILSNLKIDEVELGKRSYEWVRKYHDPKRIAKTFVEIVMEGEK